MAGASRGSSGRAATRTRTPRPSQLPSLTIEDGTVAIEDAVADRLRLPGRIRDLDADVGVVLGGGRTDLTIRRATLQAADPDLAVSALSGHWVAAGGRHDVQDLHLRTARGALDGDFTYEPAREGRAASVTAQVETAPFDLEEFAGIVPALAGRGLVLTGSARIAGPVDNLSIQTRLTDPRAGHVSADVVLSTSDNRRTIRGGVVTTNLDLARALVNPPLASRLTSKGTIDLVFTGGWSFDALSGSATVESTRSAIWGYQWDALRGRVRFGRRTLAIDGTIAAYGATGTAAGTIVPVGGPVQYSLRGHLSGVDMRRLPEQLPIPALESHDRRPVRGRRRGVATRGQRHLRAIHGRRHQRGRRQHRSFLQPRRRHPVRVHGARGRRQTSSASGARSTCPRSAVTTTRPG